MNVKALDTFLKPINKFLELPDVNEVLINKPQEIWVEKKGSFEKIIVNELDINHLTSLGRLVAQYSDQDISAEKPLLSATIPTGERIQIVFPPVCSDKFVAMSIRKPSVLALTLDDYESMGAFDNTATEAQEDKNITLLKQLIAEKKIKEFLLNAIRYKKNIIISGGTSSGKTTFTNAMLQAIPLDERIITCEDAKEIKLPHENKLSLLASKGDQGRANVTMQDLIESCLRLRPDRIIVGELRGKEAFSFLRAINTGHPGSISTLHADNPQGAIQQLSMMVMQAGFRLDKKEVVEYINSVVDIIIQLKRGEKGVRYISEIFFTK